jgi:CRP-like cAMP-binding protein
MNRRISAASLVSKDHDGGMAESPTVPELLRSVPVFAHLPPKALDQVSALAKDITHSEGHVVVREGAGAHAVHVIVSGEAKVSVDGAEIAVLGPGDHFGEIALLSGGTRTATVTAACDLRVLAIDAISFLRLVHSDPVLKESLPPVISARLRELDEKRPG